MLALSHHVPALELTPYVDMIIADRGFCDLYTLAERKFSGTIAKMLFKYVTVGWQLNNAFNLLFLKKHQPKSHLPRMPLRMRRPA